MIGGGLFGVCRWFLTAKRRLQPGTSRVISLMSDESPLASIKDPQLRAMLKRLGERLAASPRAEPEPETPAPDSPYWVDRWPNSRFYAAYRGDKLLAVTVYKKG